MLSFLAKMQRVYRFLEVWQGLRHGTDDCSAAVTAEGLLKDSC
jgi:hypothetical protein